MLSDAVILTALVVVCNKFVLAVILAVAVIVSFPNAVCNRLVFAVILAVALMLTAFTVDCIKFPFTLTGVSISVVSFPIFTATPVICPQEYDPHVD